MENALPSRRFAPTALMLGNLVTGCSVLAPAGMLSELSEGFAVSISTAGLLITFGAVMLCVASPLSAWLTSRIERRALLSATLAVLALGNLASSRRLVACFMRMSYCAALALSRRPSLRWH